MPNYDYLKDIYADLSKGADPVETNLKSGPNVVPVQRTSVMGPSVGQARQQINRNCNDYQEDLSKNIVTDIYTKALPFDQEYKDGNKGQIAADIDVFLKGKDTTAFNYIKSACEKTGSPLLEMILKNIHEAVEIYREEAEKEIDPKAPAAIPPPVEEALEEPLQDTKDDIEYKTFEDRLKKKLMKKIVDDISEIIDDRKTENNLSFNVNKNESCFQHCISFMSEKTLQAGGKFEATDEVLGLAIRESTLHELDVLFRFDNGDNKMFERRLRASRGILLTEASFKSLMERMGHDINEREIDLYSKAADAVDDAGNEKELNSTLKSIMRDTGIKSPHGNRSLDDFMRDKNSVLKFG
jgi:hypothetical protein